MRLGNSRAQGPNGTGGSLVLSTEDRRWQWEVGIHVDLEVDLRAGAVGCRGEPKALIEGVDTWRD